METLNKPPFYEWMQGYYYLRDEVRRLTDWIDTQNTNRACEGIPRLKTNPLDNQEVIDHLSESYYELRLKNKIQMDFEQFLLEIENLLVYGRTRNPYRSRRDCTNCEFRGHTKYVKNTDHKPKEEKDTAWQDHTHHKKDKAKHGQWFRSAKKYIINKEERSFRRWTKAQIKAGNYDALGDDWIQDKWLWD
jgi:hypothetical protein